MSTKSRILKGLFATGFGQVITILIQLAGLPIFLHFWGTEKYGEWMILSAIPAYLAMSDFGFASVAANDMTMNVAKGEYKTANKTFHSIFVVILMATVISGLAIAVFIFLETTYDLLPIKLISDKEVAIVIAIQWLQVIVGQISGQISAGYRCDGNFAISVVYGNIIRLVEFIVTIALLATGGDFIKIVLGVLTVRILGTLAVGINLKRRSSWLSFGVSQSTWQEIKRLLRPALAFMAFPLGNAISLQGFTLVVGTLLGGSAVTLFATYRTLTRFPLQLMGMINSSVWPELSRAFGADDIAQARNLHRLAVGASTWSILIAITVLYFMGEYILKYWTHGQIPFQPKLLLILGLVILANSFWYTSGIVATSINKHEKIAMLYLTGSILALGLSLFLGKHYGLSGIAESLLAIDVLMTLFVLRQSIALTHDKLLAVILAVVLFPFNGLKMLKKKSNGIY